MPHFEPFTPTTTLPPLGALETLALDFKGTVAGTRKQGNFNYPELAKDVAAFANQVGGVLLVGACEDKKRGVLGVYSGLGLERAKEIRSAYSQAVSDLCSPHPVFDATNIALDSGYVVAINVWPFPGQAVGVRQGAGSEAYEFPLRVGIDTRYLRPEQLPMLMIPELRRTLAQLHAIPHRATVELQRFAHGGGGAGPKTTLHLEAVDELGNAIVFAYPGPAGAARFTVPIDNILAIWKDVSGVWGIRVEG